MENKKRSLRLVLVLALLGFGSIVYVASHGHKYQGGDMSAKLSFGLDLDLKWIATDANADFAVVQDTLAFYAEALHQQGAVVSSRYRLDHCCADVASQSAFSGGGKFYHLELSANFASESERSALFGYLQDQGLMQSHGVKAWFGNLNGNVDLTLPIPSRPGEFLHLQGSQFELSMMPRPVNALVEVPVV